MVAYKSFYYVRWKKALYNARYLYWIRLNTKWTSENQPSGLGNRVNWTALCLLARYFVSSPNPVGNWWRIQGRGPRSPLFLDQKNFFWSPGPPLISRSRSGNGWLWKTEWVCRIAWLTWLRYGIIIKKMFQRNQQRSAPLLKKTRMHVSRFPSNLRRIFACFKEES